MSISDFIDSIRDAVHGRLTSPLSGSLALSWLVWNHRLLFVLFSDADTADKFHYIDSYLYPDWQAFATYGIGYPLATTAAYLFAYPFLARPVYRFALEQKQALRNVRNDVEKREVLTREEMDRREARINKQLASAGANIQKYEGDVERLEGLIQGQNEIIATQSNELEALRARVPASTLEGKDAQIASYVQTRKFKLNFNPKTGGSKPMQFGSEGRILEGANKNESTWKAQFGYLDFYNSDGKQFNQFELDPSSGIFVATNRPTLLAIKDQTLEPL